MEPLSIITHHNNTVVSLITRLKIHKSDLVIKYGPGYQNDYMYLSLHFNVHVAIHLSLKLCVGRSGCVWGGGVIGDDVGGVSGPPVCQDSGDQV